MPTTLNSLNTLFVHELRDLYSAETQLLEALPKMAQNATHDELKQAFEEHLSQTRGHVERLRDIFDRVGESPEGKHCEAMEGLIEEGEDIMEQQGDSVVKDAALIAAAQRAEHYEISGYGTARTYANELGMTEEADLLDETLSEEKKTDKRLTKIATGGWISSGINEEAQERARQ